MKNVLLLVPILLFVMTGQTTAATITVANTDDAGPGSLRQAIIDAISGDTIDFAANVTGSIVLTGGSIFFTKDLTITGPGQSVLSIDGNMASKIFSSSSSNLSISGLTLTNGAISGPSTGACADFSTGMFTMTDCTISNNICTIGAQTGGIHIGAGTAIITRCVFSGNQADFRGGALSFGANTISTITDCTFTGNSATSDGGAIRVFFSTGITVMIDRSTFSGNTAGGTGGAIYSEATGTTAISIINSTFSGNTANGAGGGGAINNTTAGSTFNLMNCTVTGNTVTAGPGGGLYNLGGTFTLQNTIVAGNLTSGTGSDPDICLTFTSNGSNIIGDPTGGSGFTNGVNGDQVGTAIAPLDPLLGPLQNNGGKTLTHALLGGSPAINNADSAGSPSVDQRNRTRPALLKDIGSYELIPGKKKKDKCGALPGGDSPLAAFLPFFLLLGILYYQRGKNPTVIA